MKKILSYYLFTIALIASNSADAQHKHRKANSNAPGEHIYKHYAGTIGDRHIALDLRWGYQGGSNDGGSYYYDLDKPGTKHIVIGEPESFDHGVPMNAEEGKENTELGKDAYFPDRNNLAARWRFTISGDSLTGTYRDVDTKKKYDIRLKEDYSNSYELDMIVFTDEHTPENSDGKPLATVYFSGVRPSFTVKDDDAAFINDAQFKFLGAARIGATNWDVYPRLLAKSYYQQLIAKKDVSSPYLSSSLLPVYNENGLVVLERSTVFFDSVSYLCLDVRNKKQIRFNDVLKADNKKLSALLEKSLREKYKLDPDKKLSTWLLVDKMPVTKNIMLVHKGINFTYNNGEILNIKSDFGTLSSVTIFLPYEQLSGLLQPEFKKRMNL